MAGTLLKRKRKLNIFLNKQSRLQCKIITYHAVKSNKHILSKITALFLIVLRNYKEEIASGLTQKS